MIENVTYCDKHVSSQKCIFFVVLAVFFCAHEAWTWRVGTGAFALVEHLHDDDVVVVLELVVDAVRRCCAHDAWT